MLKEMVFALVDCNNFYVSCHQLFMPHLAGRAVVVLSANDGNVIARSESAKRMGIPMSAPVFEWKKHIAAGTLMAISATFPLYADMSLRFAEVLDTFGPCEQYSIDEIFVRLSPTANQHISEQAMHIRQTVDRLLGLPVAVGLGPSKGIAKLANRLAKKRGLAVMDLASDPHARERLFTELAVEEAWGLGVASARALHQAGIHTLRQLTDEPDHRIKQLLGIRGQRLVWDLRGYPLLPLQEEVSAPKSIGRSRAFGRAVYDKANIEDALALYVSRAVDRLHRFGLCASALSVHLTTNPFRKREGFYSNVASVQLLVPTNATPLLLQEARRALERIYRPGLAYYRTGVQLLGLVPTAPQQQSWLLDERDQHKYQRMMQAITDINQRFGRDTIFLGVLARPRSWQKQPGYPGLCSTTRLSEVASVSAR